MTHEEAYDLVLKVKWKTEPCIQSGEQCWCRLIVPEVPIKYDKDEIEEVYIVGSGAMHKKLAEHIVELHNKSLGHD